LKQNSRSPDASEDEKTLLGVFFRLELEKKDPESGEVVLGDGRRVKPTKEGISTLNMVRNNVLNCFSTLDDLVSKDLLSLNREIYSLTKTGREIGKRKSIRLMSDFYGDILVRSAESRAHSLFCEKVFGKNLCQFNVTDMVQLETMLDSMSFGPSDFVLDLGCGPGRIAEYIANETGARVLGIDFAERVVNWAQNNTKTSRGDLEFRVGNINELSLPPSTFDAIVAIDTLYPWNVDDLEGTIAELKGLLKPNGRMGIFFAQFRKTDEPIDLIEADKTRMATALRKNHLEYTSIDFSENARAIWHREISAANELREMFEKEGNLDLCEQRLADSKQTLHHMDTQQERRYFYHVRSSI